MKIITVIKTLLILCKITYLCRNYYFSIENLNKDFFIRSKLNEEGYLEAEEIINFNK